MFLKSKIKRMLGVKAGWIDNSIKPAVIHKGYRFFAEYPTEVPDDEGIKILAQNPNLIAEWDGPVPDRNFKGEPIEQEQDKIDLLDVVAQIEKLNLLELRLSDLTEWGAKIGVKILNNQAKKLAIKMIEDRCLEIVTEAEK